MSLLLENIIHVANLLYLASYLVRDILWLRILTIIAGSSLVVYFYFQPNTLWAPVLWNLVFIAINGYQCVFLLRERRPVQFSNEELTLYQSTFQSLTPRDFKRLLTKGNWRDAASENKLVKESSVLEHLFLVTAGSMSVRKAGQPIAQLSSGSFIGELSFLTGAQTSADVVAEENSRYVAWSFADLKELMARNPSLEATFQSIISADLANKLRSHR